MKEGHTHTHKHTQQTAVVCHFLILSAFPRGSVVTAAPLYKIGGYL
jgi:hypothetical protein